jgi:hypothetical protein
MDLNEAAMSLAKVSYHVLDREARRTKGRCPAAVSSHAESDDHATRRLADNGEQRRLRRAHARK